MNSTTTTTESSVTQPAVYVGTYHKYNGGSIAGAWLTLTGYDDEAGFLAACHALHANEADPELMFQDIEGTVHYRRSFAFSILLCPHFLQRSLRFACPVGKNTGLPVFA